MSYCVFLLQLYCHTPFTDALADYEVIIHGAVFFPRVAVLRNCSGSEESLTECPHSNEDKLHCHIAKVYCSGIDAVNGALAAILPSRS